MPRGDVALTDKLALLEKIKNQPPNSSHCQLAEITGVVKSIIARVIIASLGSVRGLV
jgi:transcriptional regulator with AAA-type ATPase domain